MYFQTGQVIFVPEWPNGEFVNILASFCVWTKSLKCKDAVNMDSTIQSLQVRGIQVPSCQPSGRPSVHCSIRPDDVSSRLNAIQTSIIHPDEVFIPSEPHTVSRSFLCQLAFVRTFQQHVQTPPSTRSASDFFPSSEKGKTSQSSGRCGIPSGRVSS
jgi:hypothetical protein